MKFGASQNLVQLASDPGSPANGDVWYNTTAKVGRIREDGITRNLSSDPEGGRTGMALVFDRAANYGYPTAETGSAFTITDSTAVVGVILFIRVNRATEPTYTAKCVCISGKFKASVDNFYYFECLYVAGSGGADNVYHYTISQTPT